MPKDIMRFMNFGQGRENIIVVEANVIEICIIQRIIYSRELRKPDELLSDMGRKNNPFLMDDKTLEYYECGWKRNKDGNLVVCVRIVFNQEWWEDRELDMDTGKLKGLLGEGRL